jgi:hypothetical protein
MTLVIRIDSQKVESSESPSENLYDIGNGLVVVLSPRRSQRVKHTKKIISHYVKQRIPNSLAWLLPVITRVLF